jgi:hypothetical protein
MTPFQEALRQLGARRIMPTALDSAGLRTLDAGLRRQSFFSAETLLKDYLEEAKRVTESIVNPVQVQRSDDGGQRTVTEGYNPATAREALRNELRRLGYATGDDIEGSIKDLSSDARINLVVKTNVELAQGAGHFVQQNDPNVVDLYPALELTRFEQREEPRDWPQRWRISAAVANDPGALAALELHGRMVALKSSGIWQALGDYGDDTLGNPYPPFAFNSGMWTQDVGRADAQALGLISPGEQAQPADFNLADMFNPPAVAALLISAFQLFSVSAFSFGGAA